jgi:hypothetical protein
MKTDTATQAAAAAFFVGCYDEAALKTRFRDLCKIHHPDRGGDLATMQALNAAYECALRGEFRKTMSDDDAEEAVNMSVAVAAKVAEIIGLEGLILEIVGRWLWVTGDTFTHRGALKTAGLWFASKKRAWYWHTPEDSVPRGGKKSLEEIRSTYGSQRINAGARGSFLPA